MTPAKQPEVLPPDLQAILGQLDQLDASIENLTDGLSEAQMNRAPRDSAWSIAQCLDHLVKIDSIFLDAITKATEKAGRQPHARPPVHPNRLERFFLKSLEPPPRQKFRAPRVIMPARNLNPADTLLKLRQKHEQARTLIVRTRQLNLNRIRLRHPLVPHAPWLDVLQIFRAVRLSAGTLLLWMLAHERRHLWQAGQAAATFRPRGA